MGTIGLSPNIDNLDGFFASAGVGYLLASVDYLDSRQITLPSLQVSVSRRGASLRILAVYNNQVDPPFVHDEWAAGEFQIPAIQIDLDCASPSSLNVTTNADGSHITLATSSDECSASNILNPSGGTEQFSVFNVSSCGASGFKFQPVVFWFYLNSSSPQVASECIFTVETSVNLTTASLGDCTTIEPVQGTNNVTGSPQYGRPCNGQVPTVLSLCKANDPYVSSRVLAVNFGLPDAMRPGNQGDHCPFFKINTVSSTRPRISVGSQYLSIATQINYFLKGNSTTPAQLTTEIPRLFVE
ncbi:hypothetical protein JVT61DRAFT_1942 [Boletus reticuloceps]|uniref:Uncharacterized protein n=1 Tax=Boletus reticuloceps TaxID=495285 RepID=A0A8I2YBW2_9AGAM|nr:hypothetical protein JVT61DRAFT_1942 [Boletus reticuloceps]